MRVSRRIAEMLTDGTGGGTVGQVMTTGGLTEVEEVVAGGGGKVVGGWVVG